MKSKVKNMIYFMIIIVIIIGLYLILLNNVGRFTLDYDGELFSYDKNQEVEDKELRIRKYLYTAEASSLTQEEKEKIASNKVIQGIYGKDGENTKQYVEEYMSQKIIPNTKYGDILCVSNNLYDLAITEDLKNLYYYLSTQTKADGTTFETITDAVPEEMNQKKEDILARINEQLDRIGIQKAGPMVADSILIQKYPLGDNQYNYVYIIEDTKNDIRVHYSITNAEIVELIMGFN